MAAALLVLSATALGWIAIARLLPPRETTDNAYVGGEQVPISARIAGTVAAVHVRDMQRVRAGDLLVELDATDARVALDRARANLAAAVRTVQQMHDAARAGDAAVFARSLELEQARADLRRREPLLATQAVAAETIAHARDAVATAEAALRVARHQAAAARVLVANTAVGQHPNVLAARAAYIDAWLALNRTRIHATVGGDVVQRTVQPGVRIEPGGVLLKIVRTEALWVDANFKESQLRDLRLGQPVTVRVDLYGGAAAFRGQVAGFNAGTGAAFALLPPQNAAGNWVKVTQRLPVRIALDPVELQTHPLRLGLSARVAVDTRNRAGVPLAPAVDQRQFRETTAPPAQPAEIEANHIIAAVYRDETRR
ncbi:MAG: efflux RND transporter periplasmic adaptor subunit [Gammaproteobacteria bacterium]